MRRLILLFSLIAFIGLSSFEPVERHPFGESKIKIDMSKPAIKSSFENTFSTQHETEYLVQMELKHPVAIVSNDDGTLSEIPYTDDLRFKTMYRCETPKKDGCRICCTVDWRYCWQDC